jgi:DNA-binding transcriptional regulator YiaG
VKALPLVEGENRTKYEKDLKFIHDSVKTLLESSSLPNHGKDFMEMIKTIFQREEHWISWKNASCPPFERMPSAPTAEGEASVGVDVGVKRKFEEINESDVKEKDSKKSSSISIYEQAMKGYEEKRNSFLFDCSEENIKEIAKNLVASYPDFETQISVSFLVILSFRLLIFSVL